ncbi:MAG: hypothetical protein QOG15_3825 [Solirubrobacteraceae bacterium]|nr:hypothetical protein [Solirubrobacteraceae bacterium]
MIGSNAARKSAAAGAGLAGGIAVAALVLPQLASTFNPTKLGTALLAIVLALLTTAVQRWLERTKQRGALASAVRTWPPQRLAGADLGALGVFPARGSDGKPEPYRSRAEDDAVRAALQDAKVVVVHGPPSAGKSRTAAEAARQAFGSFPVIVPVNADALSWFADSGIKLDLPETRICLWLDGLERFIAALDPPALESLDSLGSDVTVVATIRTEEWQKLLGGTDQKSQTARTLAAGATTFELGPPPDRTSAGDPEPAHGNAALPPVRALSPPWRDAWFLLLGAGLLVTLVVTLFVGLAGNLVDPKPISEQMDQIKTAALHGAGGRQRHVVIDARVKLHPAEADSWLLVLEDGETHDEFYAGAANGKGPPPHSDEVRIYDVRDGRLRLALDYQPNGTGSTAAEWRELGAGATLSADYDKDGSDEIIAGYAIPAQATEAFVPFAIDHDNGRYRLLSLTPDKPDLSRRGLAHDARRFRRQAYQEPRTFPNAIRDSRFRKLAVTGYRVQTFALVDSPRRLLLTAYFTELPVFAQPRVVELHANQFRSGKPEIMPCTPDYFACRAPKLEQDVLVPPDRTMDGALLEAWKKVGDKWTSTIRVTQRAP